MPAELATSLTVTEADRLLQAEALVRAYCGWHIAPSRVDAEAVLRAEPGNPVLLLPSLYVTAVAVNANDTDLVDGTDYAWSANGVLTCYWWTTSPVTVTYTHGYAAPPAEVTAVVQAVAQRALDNPGAYISRTIGPFGGTFGRAADTGTAVSLLASEMAVLDRYKIPARP